MERWPWTNVQKTEYPQELEKIVKTEFFYLLKHKTKKGDIRTNNLKCHIIRWNLYSGDTLGTKASVIINQQIKYISFFSASGICCSYCFKQLTPENNV